MNGPGVRDGKKDRTEYCSGFLEESERKNVLPNGVVIKERLETRT